MNVWFVQEALTCMYEAKISALQRQHAFELAEAQDSYNDPNDKENNDTPSAPILVQAVGSVQGTER